MKTFVKLCALVCLLSLASFGQSIWGSLPPAADCTDGFSVTLKPQNPYSPQGGSFQLPGTYVCHSHVWYWQPPKVDSVKFYDSTSMATGAESDPLSIHTSALDTGGTLAANSDAKVASQKATKTYVDAAVGAFTLPVLNAVTNPAANKSFDMTSKTLNFNFTGDWGAGFAYSIVSNGSNASTGPLVQISTGASTTQDPLQACAQGTTNCLKVDKDGKLSVSDLKCPTGQHSTLTVDDAGLITKTGCS